MNLLERKNTKLMKLNHIAFEYNWGHSKKKKKRRKEEKEKVV